MAFLEEILPALDEFSNRDAVISRDGANILDKFSFCEVKRIYETFSSLLLQNHIEEACVGLLMQHNVYIPSVIIGLQKHHCSFFFLDANSETDSLELIQRAKLNWLVTLSQFGENSRFISESHVVLQGSLDISRNATIRLYRTNVSEICIRKDICYVIQTSGTTSTDSKLVYVENYCIKSNIDSLKNIFKITHRDLIYFGTSLFFDPSMVELFLGLVCGACLLIVPQKVHINPVRLHQTLFPSGTNIPRENRPITVLQMPPSVFLRWSKDQIIHALKTLKLLALGGEKFPQQILEYEKDPDIRIFNLYGITEVSCWASVCHVNSDSSRNHLEVPLGTCLNDTLFEVRDTQGDCGELFIGSSTRICYLNEECVVEKPLFRATGDLVRKTENNIYFETRKTELVKRMGHRISLSRIEKLITLKTGLKNAVIWNADTSKLLVCFEIPECDQTSKPKVEDKLRVRLLHILPKESFPDRVSVIPRFPLTRNGKIDKKVLLENCFEAIGSDWGPARIFEHLWGKYFGYEAALCKEMNFFEIGGNSILAIQLISEFSEMSQLEYPNQLVNLVFESTYAECCEFLSSCVYKIKKRKLGENEIGNAKAKVNKTNVKAENMKTNWSYNLEACVDATATIFENGGRTLVAIGAFSHIFTILDLATGEKISDKIFEDSVENSSCIVPDSDELCVGCHNGSMYCLNINTCNVVWEYKTNDVIKNLPCLCRNNRAIVFGSYDKNVYCLDVVGGQKLWSTFVKACVTSNPIYIERTKSICVATLMGTCMSLSEETGDIMWSYECGIPIFGSPCLMLDPHKTLVVWPDVQGSLYSFHSDSSQLIWKFEGTAQVFSKLLRDGNTIIATSKDHHVYFFEFDESSCRLRNQVSLGSSVTTDPVLANLGANGRLLIVASNGGSIFSINPNSCEVVGTFTLPGEVFSSPKVVGNQVVIGCRDNNVYCLEIISD